MAIRILFILLLLVVSSTSHAQTRRAIVIGIGKHEDKTWGKINGDKDVPYVEEMLVNAKFKAGNVKKLVNQQATKAAIVSAFKSLASQSKRGDMVYVHFSGHGQQMKDVHNDEKDGLDECWIPYDAYRKPCEKDKGEKHLTDDEVNYYLNAIRDKIGDSGKMLVVIDACHSGDATRGDEDEVVRGVEDIFEAIKTFIWGASTDKGKTDVNPNAQVNKERWITISACKSDQVNIEMKSPAVGKLTYAIYNKVKESTGNDNDDFFRRIRMFVNSNTGSRPQYPVMTGETDRFRITDIHHKVVMMMHDAKIMANELMRKAANYTINQWKSLRNILKDGSAEISNNLCEQRMKPVKLLLKNCMNIGSEAAAENSAFIFSLIESCKLNDINPQDYLKHLFECVLHGKDCDKKALLP